MKRLRGTNHRRVSSNNVTVYNVVLADLKKAHSQAKLRTKDEHVYKPLYGIRTPKDYFFDFMPRAQSTRHR